jgi:hypothetical protein
MIVTYAGITSLCGRHRLHAHASSWTAIFFIITFLAVLVFPIVNFYYIFPLFSKVAVQGREDDASRLARHLAGMVFGENGDVQETQQVRETIEGAVENFNLWKLRVYSSEGTVLLSSEPGEKGERFHEEFFFEGSNSGRVVFELVRKNARTREGEVVSRDVLEIMVPVEGKNGLKGAFEIYFDITDQLQRLSTAVTHSAVLLLGFVFALFVSILVFLIRLDSKQECACHGTAMAIAG